MIVLNANVEDTIAHIAGYKKDHVLMRNHGIALLRGVGKTRLYLAFPAEDPDARRRVEPGGRIISPAQDIRRGFAYLEHRARSTASSLTPKLPARPEP